MPQQDPRPTLSSQAFAPYASPRDIAVNESENVGLRVAVIWVLDATYSGVPLYGKPTGSAVKVLGASHYEFRDGKILREWRIYDEIAVLAQILKDRGEASSFAH